MELRIKKQVTGWGVLGLTFFALNAFGFAGGAIGYSGKGGNTCNNCHAGGAAPTVTFTGPATLAPGAIGDYMLTVTGGAGVTAGITVDTDNPAITFIGNNDTTRVLSAQIIQNGEQAFVNGSVEFLFQVQAPDQAGNFILYGAGNSCNDNGNTGGDRSATTMMSVSVVVGGGTGGGGGATGGGGGGVVGTGGGGGATGGGGGGVVGTGGGGGATGGGGGGVVGTGGGGGATGGGGGGVVGTGGGGGATGNPGDIVPGGAIQPYTPPPEDELAIGEGVVEGGIGCSSTEGSAAAVMLVLWVLVLLMQRRFWARAASMRRIRQ